MRQLVIIGAGGFGREVLAWASACSTDWKPKGFLDDDGKAANDLRLRAPVLGSVATYRPVPEDIFLCAIGNPTVRRSISSKIKAQGGNFATLVHPTAVVADGARLGEGVIVCPHALVSVDSWIKDGVVVYYHSSVDHDAVVGPWTQISGHCDIMGGAVVGEEVFVGSHAAILPKVQVGDRAIIGAGAVVTGDIPTGATVVGVPARRR